MAFIIIVGAGIICLGALSIAGGRGHRANSALLF